jgi:transcription elongation factor GreA
MTRPDPVDDSLITADGYELLRHELEQLRSAGRRELAERIAHVREDGSLDDNLALIAVLEEQAQLDARIGALTARLAEARVAPPPRDGSAGIGCAVRVRRVDTDEVDEYELVGALDPDIGNGRVSLAAPVGRALAGCRPGAHVEVAAPRGLLVLEVLSVRPPQLRRAA